ncbi:MAG: HNH endonuclease [Lachnospiraceae bacterium]|nr:HNH endonuclease [Lachnospiraceae bacterium]
MTEHRVVEPHIKQAIHRKQNKRCAYCGQHRNIKYMTVDHIIPLSKGGTDDINNLQCTCKLCNRLKDNMMPHEFTAFIRRMLKNSIKIEKRARGGGRMDGQKGY